MNVITLFLDSPSLHSSVSIFFSQFFSFLFSVLGSMKEILKTSPWAFGTQSFRGNVECNPKDKFPVWFYFQQMPNPSAAPSFTLALLQAPRLTPLPSGPVRRVVPKRQPKRVLGETPGRCAEHLPWAAGEGWAGIPPGTPASAPAGGPCFQDEAAFDMQRAAPGLWYAVLSLDLMSSAGTRHCS